MAPDGAGPRDVGGAGSSAEPHGEAGAAGGVVAGDLRDAGSAVVEFVLVSVLLTTLFLGVMQVGLAMYVRNTLVSCAQEGARFAANADRTLADGVQRTQRCTSNALPMARPGTVAARTVMVGSVPAVEVEVTSRLPLIGPFGPRSLRVRGHAFWEGG